MKVRITKAFIVCGLVLSVLSGCAEDTKLDFPDVKSTESAKPTEIATGTPNTDIPEESTAPVIDIGGESDGTIEYEVDTSVDLTSTDGVYFYLNGIRLSYAMTSGDLLSKGFELREGELESLAQFEKSQYKYYNLGDFKDILQISFRNDTEEVLPPDKLGFYAVQVSNTLDRNVQASTIGGIKLGMTQSEVEEILEKNEIEYKLNDYDISGSKTYRIPVQIPERRMYDGEWIDSYIDFYITIGTSDRNGVHSITIQRS